MISPAVMELANLLSEPRAYEAIVDAMPYCPATFILHALGYGYGLYSARAAPTRPPHAQPAACGAEPPWCPRPPASPPRWRLGPPAALDGLSPRSGGQPALSSTPAQARLK